jgi:FHS family L-fucose permease-like MFS transporter
MALAGPSVTTVENKSEKQTAYLIPLVLVTSLFFLWGMAYGLLDVLNKHFQETLNVTKSRSTLLQAAYFGAYFLVALPAGIFMNKYGYKKGIIMGLLLYACGAFLFYPAAEQMNFNFFVIALFVLASGLTCLETAANPYVTVLGPPDTAAFRLNLSQCFNGVGAFIGPVIAANLFFRNGEESGQLDTVKLVYIIIGVIVLMIAVLFFRTPLPEIKESEIISSKALDRKPLFKHSNFTGGVIAQFFYVAAQVGIAALFINYCTESGNGIDNSKASYLLATSLLLFTIGRFAGTALMRKIAPNKLLSAYAIINVILCIIVVAGHGWMSVYCLMALFFFQSIMFPTIFALGLKDLGHHTKKGSSFLIMSIVGGACMPVIMGIVADKYSTAAAYLVPMLCFLVVAWYGWKGYRVKA